MSKGQCPSESKAAIDAGESDLKYITMLIKSYRDHFPMGQYPFSNISAREKY